MNKIKTRKALVTGANGDIGYALLHNLLNQGYLTLAMDKDINRLLSLQSAYSILQTKKIDLSEPQQIENITEIGEEPYDVLIYAAGIREIIPAAKLSIAEWQQVLAVNLTSAWVISKQVAQLAMKHDHPLCIIFISSISGLAGEAQRSAYCASKHGLIGLAKSLAMEWADYNIRINVIAPGIIETALTKPYQSNPQLMDQINQNIPLKRWGKPRHIAQTAELIMNNDYLTGSTFVVDGGWMAGKQL